MITFPWPAQIPKPKSLHFLTLSGSIEGGTLTMLVFPDQDKKPALVLRILRDESELPHFLNERDVLNKFHGLSPFLKNSVPNLFFCENLDGVWMSGESVVTGVPLDNHGQIGLVFTWLKVLASETKRKSDSGLMREVSAKKIIAEFQNYFSVSKEEQDFFQDMLKSLRAHESQNSTTYLVHGDFSRHNLFFSKEKQEETLHVIDWMSARWSPFPLHDACLFLTTFLLQNRKEPGLQGYLDIFSESFFTKNNFSLLAKDMLLDYCRTLNLDQKLLPFFFGLFLMEQSIIETRRILALSKRGYIPRRAVYQGLSISYEQALKNQIWTEFFHFFVVRKSSFYV